MLSAKAKTSGLTLVELLVVVTVIVILFAMIMPRSGPKTGSYTVMCMSNLKQVALAFSLYAEDNSGKFPMQASLMSGGTTEFKYGDHVFPYFEKVMKNFREPNESQLLRILVCPIDKTRQAATNYEALNDLNISYFLNTDASYTNNPSHSILAGDRNLKSNGQAVKPGLLVVTTNVDLNWSGELHIRGGNLAFADGHVQWSKTNELNSLMRQQPLVTNHIVVP